jgi:hypothetical protein
MNTREKYETPELKLVGDTSDVVFGLGGAGDDYIAELNIPEMEFAAD